MSSSEIAKECYTVEWCRHTTAWLFITSYVTGFFPVVLPTIEEILFDLFDAACVLRHPLISKEKRSVGGIVLSQNWNHFKSVWSTNIIFRLGHISIFALKPNCHRIKLIFHSFQSTTMKFIGILHSALHIGEWEKKTSEFIHWKSFFDYKSVFYGDMKRELNGTQR